MTGAAALRLAAAHAVGGACGAVAWVIGLPLPWLLGALLLVGGVSVSGADVPMYRPLRDGGVLVLLTGVGLTFTPDAAQAMLAQLHIIALGAVATLLFAAMGVPFLARYGNVSRRTAWFACIPGGPAEMSLLGERFGGDPAPIAFSQLMRIVLLVLTLPPLMALSGWHGVLTPQIDATAFDAAGYALILSAALAVALGLRRLGLATAFLVGPLLVGCGLAILDRAPSSAPYWAMSAAQVAMGVYLGAQFSRKRLAALRQFLPGAFINVVMLTLLCAALGVALHWLNDEDSATMILATAPGSVAEMALTANALHLNTPVVLAYHVVRILVVLLLAVPMFHALERLGLFRNDAPAPVILPSATLPPAAPPPGAPAE